MDEICSLDRDLARELVESSPDGLLVVRGDHVAFANAAAMQLLGVDDADRLHAGPVWMVFDEGSRAAIRELLARVRHDGSATAVDARVATRPTVVAEIAAARLADTGDVALCLTLRNVSARRRAEATLRENEERLRLAFAGAEEGVWDWDLRTGAVVYSSRWKEMLGYADEEIGPHVRAWEELLHPDDRRIAETLYTRVVESRERYEAEFRLRHKAGHYITVLTRGFAVEDADGRVVRIVGTHLDITDRKRTETALRESEERLRLAFDGAQEGVWDWNLETNAVVYSTQWKQMLGYTDDEIEPHISAWERLVHPADRAIADAAADRVARGAPTYEAEFRLRHKDGRYIEILSRAFPIRRGPDGTVVRIVGTHFDLTERKRVEAERVRGELLGRLVFAHEEERRRIARDMHDQFGEQLTALGLKVNSLKAACGDDRELQGAVAELEAIAQRLDADVDALVWQLRPTALDDLGLRVALENYVSNWSERTGIHGSLHASGAWESRLRGELETTVYRIAQEALNNVAKHASARRVDLLLERHRDGVVLIVEDDGVGFDPATVREGAFGLVGIRERAALVHGTIEIESTPGQGTTILLRVGHTPVDVSEHA
ncbi:MAG TPA: PAS domain-containing protein [Vicinamibacterales bacterium]|nr:PAS domain-containing protein [Vicinamibacterales bacterium]